MFQVRQVYHLRFGMAGQAVELLKEVVDDLLPEVKTVVLTDVSGRDFTAVIEYEVLSLQA